MIRSIHYEDGNLLEPTSTALGSFKDGDGEWRYPVPVSKLPANSPEIIILLHKFQDGNKLRDYERLCFAKDLKKAHDQNKQVKVKLAHMVYLKITTPKAGDATSGDDDGVGVSQEGLYLLRKKSGDRAIASITLAERLGDSGKVESDGEAVLVSDTSMGSDSSSRYGVSGVQSGEAEV
ncbi:hypothetical protein Tco_0360952 [Tanacetum coccineum]